VELFPLLNPNIMKNYQRTFEELTMGAVMCIKERLHRTLDTQHHYIVLWNRIQKYMKSQEIRFLDSAVCDSFLKHEYADLDFSGLTKRDRDAIKAVEVLKEYIQTGTLVPKKELPVFNGSIGRLMADFLTYKANLRLAKHTLGVYERSE
jgi:hypothetical protein